MFFAFDVALCFLLSLFDLRTRVGHISLVFGVVACGFGFEFRRLFVDFGIHFGFERSHLLVFVGLGIGANLFDFGFVFGDACIDLCIGFGFGGIDLSRSFLHLRRSRFGFLCEIENSLRFFVELFEFSRHGNRRCFERSFLFIEHALWQFQIVVSAFG